MSSLSFCWRNLTAIGYGVWLSSPVLPVRSIASEFRWSFFLIIERTRWSANYKGIPAWMLSIYSTCFSKSLYTACKLFIVMSKSWVAAGLESTMRVSYVPHLHQFSLGEFQDVSQVYQLTCRLHHKLFDSFIGSLHKHRHKRFKVLFLNHQ